MSEAVAIAVAFVPAVADLLPANIEARAPRKEHVVGCSPPPKLPLPHYALARGLLTMTEAERTTVLDQLRERAKAAELTI